MALLLLSRQHFTPALEKARNSGQIGDMREAPRPSQKVYRQRATPSKRPRNRAHARLTVARIKWNRVFCGRATPRNSAGA